MLNRGVGTCSGEPDLETDAQSARARDDRRRVRRGAEDASRPSRAIKFQILKELNQASLGEINAIYADLNKHLRKLHVMPAGERAIDHQSRRRRPTARAHGADAAARRPPPPPPPRRSRRDGAVPAHVRQRARRTRRRRRCRRSAGAGARRRIGAAMRHAGAACRRRPAGDLPQIQRAGAAGRRYVVRADARRRRRATSRARRSSRRRSCTRASTRLQAGADGLRPRRRARVEFSGIPQGMHNVLRDLQESPLGTEGEPARVDDDRDGRDAVRLHLRDQGPARRHQGAARAAADPGAEGGDARRRVLREEDRIRRACSSTRSPQAGLGWSPVMGHGRSALQQDRRDRPPDPRRLHRRPRDLRRAARGARGVPRRGGEGRRGEHPVDRRGDQPDATGSRSPRSSRKAEIERRIEMYPVPNFLASFLRQQWQRRARARLPARTARRARRGSQASRRSRTSSGACSRRRRTEDRKHLVALLPSLLKRLSAGMHEPAAGRRRSAKRSWRTWSRRTRRR